MVNLNGRTNINAVPNHQPAGANGPTSVCDARDVAVGDNHRHQSSGCDLSVGSALSQALVRDLVRTWRHARDHQHPTLPALYSVLHARGYDMMPLAFDSLLRASEMCLERPLIAHANTKLGADEQLIFDLLARQSLAQVGVVSQGRPGMIQVFNCTLRSVWIMMSMRSSGRPSAPSAH